jgi:hypothetical protein
VRRTFKQEALVRSRPTLGGREGGTPYAKAAHHGQEGCTSPAAAWSPGEAGRGGALHYSACRSVGRSRPRASPCPLARPGRRWWQRLPGRHLPVSGTILEPHSWRILLGLLLHQLTQSLVYLTQVREAALLSLGEDEATIHCHLEATAAAGDERQALDGIVVPLKKLRRRPGGSEEVVSRHAVLDLNGQLTGHFLPPLIVQRGLLVAHVSPTASFIQRRHPPAKQSRRYLV